MANFPPSDLRLFVRFTERKLLCSLLGGSEHKSIELPSALAGDIDRSFYFEDAVAAENRNEAEKFEWIEHGFRHRKSNGKLSFDPDVLLFALFHREDVMRMRKTGYVAVCSSYRRTDETSSVFSQNQGMMSYFSTNILYTSEESLFAKGANFSNGVTLNLSTDFTNLVHNESYSGNVAGPGFVDLVNYFIKLLCIKGYDLTSAEGQAFCRDLVLKYCYVASDLESEMMRLEEKGGVLHEVKSPVGSIIELGKECFLAPECLFDPGLVGLSNAGVAACLHDISESFTGASEIPVLLCGYFVEGLPGFEARLRREITELDADINLKVQTASSLEEGVLRLEEHEFH